MNKLIPPGTIIGEYKSQMIEQKIGGIKPPFNPGYTPPPPMVPKIAPMNNTKISDIIPDNPWSQYLKGDKTSGNPITNSVKPPESTEKPNKAMFFVVAIGLAISLFIFN